MDLFLMTNTDVTHLILELLPYQDCCNLIMINKGMFHTITDATIFPTLWKILCGHLLRISVANCDYLEFEFEYGWEKAVKMITRCYKKLKRMDSPGCKYQKYLRAYQGMSPNDPLVKDIILGISLLPSTLEECFQTSVRECIFTEKLQVAWDLMSLSQRRERNSPKSIPTPLYDNQFIRRYLRLLSWVVASQNHLRLIVAEFEQLSVRGFKTNDFHPRCVESLGHIIKIGNGEFQTINLWA